MARSARSTGPREARPSRLIPRDLWSTSPRHLPRATRSAASKDSDFVDRELRQIEALRTTIYTLIQHISSARTCLLCSCVSCDERMIVVGSRPTTDVPDPHPSKRCNPSVGQWSLLHAVECPMSSSPRSLGPSRGCSSHHSASLPWDPYFLCSSHLSRSPSPTVRAPMLSLIRNTDSP